MWVWTNTHNLTWFQQQVCQKNFNKQADTLMDLLDALCSNQHARHVVELSLEPTFRRHYTALFQAIGEYHSQVGASAHLAPAPKK